MLVFARQTEEEQQVVRIGHVVQEVVRFIRASIPASIEIQYDRRADAHVMGTDTRIHQIFMNLMTNAAQAMGERGGIIRVVIRPPVVTSRDAEKFPQLTQGFINICVSDTGPGIAGECLEAVFDPYFTTKEKGMGTGLGLAVVYGIVEACNGVITVRNNPDKGAQFNVYLPMVSQTDALPSQETGAAQAPDPGQGHVCLVDDEPAIVKLNQRILTRMGYTVSAYTDSEAVLAAVKADPEQYDILVSDMTMPGLSGEQLAGALIQVCPDLPIIICTGFGKSLADLSLSRPNIRAVLKKPVPTAELSENISRILGRGDSR